MTVETEHDRQQTRWRGFGGTVKFGYDPETKAALDLCMEVEAFVRNMDREAKFIERERLVEDIATRVVEKLREASP